MYIHITYVSQPIKVSMNSRKLPSSYAHKNYLLINTKAATATATATMGNTTATINTGNFLTPFLISLPQ